uniref:Fibrous sheath CABYR binding protein n=1 Tax=Peromyscus maniculatus bairdii TaxID=230844 RepID=A0A8C8W718_PERMB
MVDKSQQTDVTEKKKPVAVVQPPAPKATLSIGSISGSKGNPSSKEYESLRLSSQLQQTWTKRKRGMEMTDKSLQTDVPVEEKVLFIDKTLTLEEPPASVGETASELPQSVPEVEIPTNRPTTHLIDRSQQTSCTGDWNLLNICSIDKVDKEQQTYFSELEITIMSMPDSSLIKSKEETVPVAQEGSLLEVNGCLEIEVLSTEKIPDAIMPFTEGEFSGEIQALPADELPSVEAPVDISHLSVQGALSGKSDDQQKSQGAEVAPSEVPTEILVALSQEVLAKVQNLATEALLESSGKVELADAEESTDGVQSLPSEEASKEIPVEVQPPLDEQAIEAVPAEIVLVLDEKLPAEEVFEGGQPPSTEEVPAEKAPAEVTPPPAEEAPGEETSAEVPPPPTEDTLVEDIPAEIPPPLTEEAPAEEVPPLPAEEAPAEEVPPLPTEDTLVEEVPPSPTEEAPAEEVPPPPTEEAPVEEEAPAEEVPPPPTEEAPAEEAQPPPPEEAPVEEVPPPPTEEAPAEEVPPPPTEEAPAEEGPTEVPLPPADGASAEMAPTEVQPPSLERAPLEGLPLEEEVVIPQAEETPLEYLPVEMQPLPAEEDVAEGVPAREATAEVQPSSFEGAPIEEAPADVQLPAAEVVPAEEASEVQPLSLAPVDGDPAEVRIPQTEETPLEGDPVEVQSLPVEEVFTKVVPVEEGPAASVEVQLPPPETPAEESPVVKQPSKTDAVPIQELPTEETPAEAPLASSEQTPEDKALLKERQLSPVANVSEKELESSLTGDRNSEGADPVPADVSRSKEEPISTFKIEGTIKIELKNPSS